MTPTELSNLRLALYDVIDEGDPMRYRTDGMTGAPWLINDLDQAFASEQRLYFVRAVLERWRHLNEGEMRKVESFAATAPEPRNRKVCDDASHKGYRLAGCLDCADEQYTRNPSMASTRSLQDG
jgi:hypothetical protein